MANPLRLPAALLWLALVCGLLAGCGSSGSAGGYFNKLFGLQSDTDRDFGEDEPQSLARQAQELMEADNYKDAAVLWQQLKDQYPYSAYAVLV